jgi:ABC-type branched-subunit amino acid transport system substrate-binding protein
MKNKGLLRLLVPISLVVALAIALPLAGCAPAAPSEVAPPEVKPIKVGAPLPMTGPMAADGTGYYQGISFAVDEINARGGLLGRPLELILFDTIDMAPERLVLAADKLVGTDKVDSAHGGWSGWGGDVEAFGKYDIPYFMYDESESSRDVMISNPAYNNVWMLGDIEKPWGVEVFDLMERLETEGKYTYPNHKIALISADDSWGLKVKSGIKDRALERGWEVVEEEVVPYGTREWGAILTKIRAEKPAWVEVEIVSPPDVITFFRQFMEEPTNTLINFGYSMVPPAFIQIMGEEANGIIGATINGGMPLPVAPTAESQDWVDRFTYKYGNPPMAGSPNVYCGVMIWAEAVEAVGDVTAYDAINEYIRTHSFEPIPGIGIYKFDEEQKLPISATSPIPHFQVQNGVLTTIWYGGPYRDYLGNLYDFQTPPWIK